MVQGQVHAAAVAADLSQISSSFLTGGGGNDGAVLAPTLSGK
jgi:hypothetical protein